MSILNKDVNTYWYIQSQINYNYVKNIIPKTLRCILNNAYRILLITIKIIYNHDRMTVEVMIRIWNIMYKLYGLLKL